ncbi:AlpA family phage regulatory protein [Serratia fonticola]|uniref:helix-turn-helix transcriptional regulator n=1 Tax=Serratia fonticola TaxID=47917 RepID=UPI0015C5FCF2|nr:AlpA family phage regulatory protein [Serratia fonticola]MBC3380419.1 AlpA family phage regulatory protein [Serratia fonticola]NYA39618.1 AlpA family phage regulatory protein [Serratia fonticola]
MKESKLLKIKEVLNRCAISRATLYRLIEAKRFPYQVSLTGSRAIAWREEDVQRWIEERPTVTK